MSTRAIRALRGDTTRLIPSTAATAVTEEADNEDDTDEEEDDDEEINTPRNRAAAFTILNTDDSDEDDDEDDEEKNDDKEQTHERNEEADHDDSSSVAAEAKQSSNKSKPIDTKNHKSDEENDDDENEDIDALVSEFQEKDLIGEVGDGNDDVGNNDTKHSVTATILPFDLIVANMDIRDFDYQYTMRTSIVQFGGDIDDANEPQSTRGTTTLRPKILSNHHHLFGPPMDGWIRPPRYIGGGMGMLSYDDHSTSGGDLIMVTPPWPYDNKNNDNNLDVSSSTILLNPKRWYTFQRSDKVKRDVQDYFSIQQSNGDINMLIMFVAHHPYVPEALLQLSSVLYQTNHTAEGYAMLRRCLYVYETSFHINFINHIILQERTYFLDMYYRNENRIFFQALFRYVQISHIAG